MRFREMLGRALTWIFMAQVLILALALLLCPYWPILGELFTPDSIIRTAISFIGSVALVVWAGMVNNLID